MSLQGTQIAARSELRNTRPLRAAMALLSLCCAGAAAYFIFSTLISVWHLGWTEMFQDQFRQYTKLLQTPFPANIFAPDNAHRQVLSNLVRLADIYWGRGEQTIGVVAGLIMMVAAMASIGVVIWRKSSHSIAYRCAASLLAAIALFWMGSARMQFHGNDSFQTYFVITCAVCVVLLVERIKLRPSWPQAAAILLIATIAMFTFGTGVAVFGLLIVMLVLRRVDIRWTAGISSLAILAVLSYLFALPGGDGVRGSLHFGVAPLASNTTTWLSSFWLTSWLSHADHSLLATSAAQLSAQKFGTGLVASARLLTSALGHPSLTQLGSAIGTLGLALLLPLIWRAWKHPARISRIESLAVALCLFSIGIGVMVALGRADLFAEIPQQVLAERYVIWTNLFWLGLGLGYGARLQPSAWQTMAFSTLALVISMMVYPTHQIGRGWAAAVEHEVESKAAQLQTGIWSDDILAHTDMHDRETLAEASRVLLENKVGPFRSARSRLLGAKLNPLQMKSLASNTIYLETPQRMRSTHESNAREWHVAGRLLPPATRDADVGLLVVDAQNVVVGLGEFGFEIVEDHAYDRIDEVCDGFDVYFRAPISEAGLRLILVDAAGQAFTILGDLPLEAESP